MKTFFFCSLICLSFKSFSQDLIQEYVLFDHGKDKLRKDSQQKLNALAERIDKDTPYQIIISGNTDNSGSDNYNEVLSQRRANTVATYLNELGIDKNKVQVFYYGEKQPKYSNDAEKHRQMNRRTDITIRFITPSPQAKNAQPQQSVQKFKNGTIIESSAEYSFDAKEIYTSNEIISRNMTTMTDSKEPLVSSGMVCVEINSANGPVNSTKEEFRLVFPAHYGDYCNYQNLLFWTATEGTDGKVYWKQSRLSIQTDTIDGVAYYVISTRNKGCYNFDCKPPKDQLIAANYKVKGYQVTRFNVVYENLISVISPEPGRKKRTYTSKLIQSNEEPVLLIDSKDAKGNSYTTDSQALSAFKYKKKLNTYVVRKSDFKKSEKAKEETISSSIQDQ